MYIKRENGSVFIILLFLALLVACLFLRSARAESVSDVVVRTIAYEASGETFDGQVMVASVIKQRMLDRGLTAERVVMQPWQFSCNNKGARLRQRTQSELAIALSAWDSARPQGYNHYHAIGCAPKWARGRLGKKVGNHIFYKL